MQIRTLVPSRDHHNNPGRGGPLHCFHQDVVRGTLGGLRTQTHIDDIHPVGNSVVQCFQYCGSRCATQAVRKHFVVPEIRSGRHPGDRRQRPRIRQSRRDHCHAGAVSFAIVRRAA